MAPGARFMPRQPRGGLELNPWQNVLAGGLQGIGNYLMAMGAGQSQQAPMAFAQGFQGFQDQQERRRQMAREDEIFQLRKDELSDSKAERDRKAAERAAAEAKFGELTALWTDNDPSNDPTGIKDILPFLPYEQQVQLAPELFAKPQEPYSAIAKAKADLDAGLITPDQFNSIARKETYITPQQGPITWSDITDDKGNIVGQRSSTGEVNYFSKYPGQDPEGPKPQTPGDLRSEYTKSTKDYEQALVGYNKVVQGANNPSAAGDIALIFGYMKTLDPNSTVREGEYATAQSAGSVPQSIAALYNRIVSGERLTQSQRADFATQAKNQFSVYQERKKVADQFYTGIAERNQVSPGDVLVPYGEPLQYLPPASMGPDERGPVVIDGVTIRKKAR